LPFFWRRNEFLKADVPDKSNFSMNAIEKPAQRPQGAARPQSLTGVRLRKHADYQRAYAAGRKRQSQSMSWFLAPQQTDGAGPRVGLTAGKVLGKAHERNRIKRRMREALRRHVELLPAGFDLILHPRRVVLTMEFAKLEAEIVRILSIVGGQQAPVGETARATAAQRNSAKPAQ
jgi:ribonuclease P protein component